MRWLEHSARPDTSGNLQVPSEPPAALEKLEREIKAELWKVRAAVDCELEEGRGRVCIVEAMRALPQRPWAVIEYANVISFLKEDPRRGVGDRSRRVAAGGADFGFDWQLENPFKRWETGRWRISWLCAMKKLDDEGQDWFYSGDEDVTDEVYACEAVKGQSPQGRIWLLGKLGTREAVDRALEELTRHAMNERNSLIAAAESVARVSHEEGKRLRSDFR
jgi:hypothetical protein